jgi:hypothetical protein
MSRDIIFYSRAGGGTVGHIRDIELLRLATHKEFDDNDRFAPAM